MALGRDAPRAKGARPLPPLLFVTDPARTPEPWRTAARLPAGAGIVLRAFGRDDAVEAGRRLADVAAARGLVLLVGQDAALAEAVGADGVHLPERDLARGPALKTARPDWIVTGAAHSAEALGAAATAGLDAALLSPVFPSASPSAGPPLGVARFSALARAAGLPVYALGGVNAATAPALVGSGACGVAAVEGVVEAFGAD